MPVYLFALGSSLKPHWFNIVLVFVVLHLFIYPASNGYNSYFDKDEQSIGGLKHPPKVSRELYWLSLIFDLVGVALGLLINWQFAFMLLIYGLVSKAYSHPGLRIKKYPWTSWIIIGLFQGYFTFCAVVIGLNDLGIEVFWQKEYVIPAFLSSMVLWGSYPMTQIYQHEEDEKRGDITLSYKLGVKGTFIFTAILFGLAMIGFYLYFDSIEIPTLFYYLLCFMLPVLAYFNYWFIRVMRNSKYADFSHTMKLNIISSLCLSAFFLLLFFYTR
jgi:1,4-dihydroxy-2-naphthoate octaprenyltransferase